MSEAIVIGAGPNGLIAAIYLAAAGAKVTIVEAGGVAGGICANRVPVGDYVVPSGPHAFAALDPHVLKELKLDSVLAFAHRDLPLIILGDGESLTLARDLHDAARGLSAFNDKDGARYAAFRRRQFAFGRAMRSLWWEDGAAPERQAGAELRRLQVTSAVAEIESAVDSDLARAAFAFDALAVGPTASGSALVLAWAAAQEMCGLQGAVAIPRGGPQTLVDALVAIASASGIALRYNSPVAAIDLDGEAVRGVVLASGERLEGRTVLSSLTRKKTLLEFLPPGAAGFAAARRLATPANVGEAKLVLALKACPPIFASPARYLFGEKLDGAAQSYAEASAGRIPSDLFLEAVTLDPGSDTGQVLLSIRIRPVPVDVEGGWKAAAAPLIQAVVRRLAHLAPGITSSVSGIGFVPPEQHDVLCLADMVSPWRTRIGTPVRGLYLCGAAAEPMPCVSGRAGRIAAAMVAADWRDAP